MTQWQMLVELLAIKLYEHSSDDSWPPRGIEPWASLTEKDRELYREKVRNAQSSADLCRRKTEGK